MICKSTTIIPAIANASSLLGILPRPRISAASIHRDCLAIARVECKVSLFSRILAISAFRLVELATWFAFMLFNAEARLLFLVAISVLTFSSRCRSVSSTNLRYRNHLSVPGRVISQFLHLCLKPEPSFRPVPHAIAIFCEHLRRDVQSPF